ncbi:MAG: KEOPS complex subunit Cgi121 [Halolamina sp.]
MRVVEGDLTVGDLDDLLGVVETVADEEGVTVQVVDARYVVSREHLERAVELADRAIARGENVARERAVETLCYLAGRRQINRALELGVGEGRSPAVVLVDAPDDDEPAEDAAVERLRSELPLDRRSTLGEYDPDRVRSFFDIPTAELDAAAADLPALVCERAALLDVEK